MRGERKEMPDSLERGGKWLRSVAAGRGAKLEFLTAMGGGVPVQCVKRLHRQS